MVEKTFSQKDIEKAFMAGIDRGVWVTQIIANLPMSGDAPPTMNEYLEKIGCDTSNYPKSVIHHLRETQFEKNSRLNR